MTKKLLITLRPVDYYFFGGEDTFDVDNGAGSRNYLVRSNRLPQQTALVGLIRHVLFQNKALSFGDESFRPDFRDQETQRFGILKNISPLFLQSGAGDQRRFLLPASKLLLSNGKEISVDFDNSVGQGFSGTDFYNTPNLEFYDDEKSKYEPYTSKEHFGDFWVALDNGQNIPAKYEQNQTRPIMDNDGIFISSLHIGIDKMSRLKKSNTAEEGATDEEGFYKQEFYRLAPGYRFAVVAEFDLSAEANPENIDLIKVFSTTMPFGGESRTFSIEAEPWTETLAELWRPATAYGNYHDRIVLSSDAFVEDPTELFSFCRFVVAESKPFRSIQIKTSEYSVEAFANLHRKKVPKLSCLLERGSVLFPIQGKEEKVIEILNKTQNFQNIGYNYFHPHQSLI